jgi:hypothetical protein
MGKFCRLLAFLAIFTVGPVLAQQQGPSGGYFSNIPGSTITRSANTTAYAANQTVCQSASTACVPGTIPVPSQGKIINRVSLLKSGSSTTNASFTIWFFALTPGLATPTQEDATSYTGPRAGDMPNYLGNATCSTGVATSDTTAQVWYECTLANPNTSGATVTAAYPVYFLISATAAYTPASGETFTPYVSGLY